MTEAVYEPVREPRTRTVELRGFSYSLTEWGPDHGVPLVLLHGWMDTGATWQFVVDALVRERRVVAPDWRGFGGSGRAAEGYYFPDYLADLDALLDRLAPTGAVDLVGHSMGGNVAGLYAGVRPERVRRLALLEGYGLADSDPDEAPERYRRWLDTLDATQPFRPPGTVAALAGRLQERHPHLPDDRAAFVADCWTRTTASGVRVMHGDPRHKRPNPVLYRLSEAEACWRRITAPVLWIDGADSHVVERFGAGPELERRRAIHGAQRLTVPAAGHMLHHDQPERVAQALESFLEGSAGSQSLP